MNARRRRFPGRYLVAIVVGAVSIVAIRSVIEVEPAPAARADCEHLTVVSSSEKADLLGDLARRYESGDPRIEGRCVAVDVVAKPSGDATDALVRGWDTTVEGPRPDVWTPVTSSWLEIAQHRLAGSDGPDLIPAQVDSIASAPLVIAMPRPMAEAMGWPTAQIGWHDLFDLATDPEGWARYGHPDWGRFTLGKTNPNFSTSGLNALIGEYYAATGTSSDLTTDAIADPAVVRFVQGVESAVVHYGDISTTFLENLRRADEAGHGLTYVSAIAIEEKSVWDYNQGNPSGDVASLGDQAPPSIPLAAVYPVEGTLVNDHPYAILDAPWVSPLRRSIAEDFLRFVLAPEQQERFQAAGFRDHAGRPGDEIDPSNGLLPDQPAVTLSTPSAVVLDAIQRSWADLRKRAHVLLILDVSGSMGEIAGGTGETKLDLAKRAAIQALAQFEPDDAVGLWIFSSDLGSGGEPFKELSPMSALGPKRAELRERIGSLGTSGGTGLYATVDHAVDVMHGSFDPDRINGIVVLTDGRNDYAEYASPDPLISTLAHQPADRTVRVFCIAYGHDADLATLELISNASTGTTYDASDPATIDDVFAAVISNF